MDVAAIAGLTRQPLEEGLDRRLASQVEPGQAIDIVNKDRARIPTGDEDRRV